MQSRLNTGQVKMCIQVNYKKCLHSKLFYCFTAKCQLTILSEYSNCVLCFDKAKDTLPPPCPLIAIHFCEVLDGPKLRHLPRFNETENDKWYQQHLENGI